MSPNGMITAARFDMFAGHCTSSVGSAWNMISEMTIASMNGY